MREMVRIALKTQLYVFLIALVTTLVMIGAGYRQEIGPFVVLTFASLALYFMGHPVLRSVAFTVWVFAFVGASMFYPQAFDIWFPDTPLRLDLGILIVPLIQIIMFGMGTTLSVKDFTRVFTMPWAVLIGMVLQFSVMPLAGYCIAMSFGFEPEIAAGVVLIGSCPGGVASNLMTYLARGNVALSVTMTSCSTLVSPLMTPLMMDRLAGQWVPIDFVEWMLKILNIIIVPVAAGLVAHSILYSRSAWANRPRSLALIAAVSGSAALGTGLASAGLFSRLFPEAFAGSLLVLKGGATIGFALVGIVALAKLVVSIVLRGPEHWMDKVLPIVSMAGICFIIAIITARSQEKLLTVGAALIAAAIIHNFVGYTFGYWCARLARLSQTAARTVAIEVGLQNGGMASSLAMDVLKSSSAALAPAIFGPWMNISGSVLATWWHRRPVTDEPTAQDLDV